MACAPAVRAAPVDNRDVLIAVSVTQLDTSGRVAVALRCATDADKRRCRAG